MFGSFLTVGEVMAWLKQQQDVETLKRRGRRRLVGAVALVLLAVIVLPMVFDPEPRARGAAGERAHSGRGRHAVRAQAPPRRAETERGVLVVQVGAFASPESVTAKLAAAKMPHYTEAVARAT